VVGRTRGAEIRDSETGDVVSHIAQNTYVDAVAISSDGTKALVAGSDGGVSAWSTHNGDLIARMEGEPRRSCGLAFQRAGNACLSVGTRGTVQFWDVHSGRSEGWFYVPESRWECFAISRSTSHIAVRGSWGYVHVLDLALKKEVHRFATRIGKVRALAFSPDGKELVADAGDYGGFHRWTHGESSLGPAIDGPVLTRLAWSEDGENVFGLGEDGALYGWASGQREPERIVFAGRGARAMTLDGGTFWFGCFDSTLAVFRAHPSE